MEIDPASRIKIKVLHIDDKLNWGGGQNQLYLLYRKQLLSESIIPYLAVSRKSVLASRLKNEDNIFHISLFSELDPFFFCRIFAIMRKIKPDIVQCHTPHSIMMVFLASRLLKKRPRIVIMRRVDNRIRFRHKYSIAGDCIVAISDNIERSLIDSGFNKGEITVIKSAVDFQAVKKEASLQYMHFKDFEDQNLMRVGSISSLYRHKGIDILIRSFDMLLKDNIELKLFIAGKGDQRGDLGSLIRELGIEDNVKFLDFTDKPYGFIKFLDIIVFPSRTEGLGTTILDAMVIGTPVIAANTGGIPEMIKNDENGLLFKPGDTEDLYKKLKHLISDPERIKKLKSSKEGSPPPWADINLNERKYRELYTRLLGGKY